MTSQSDNLNLTTVILVSGIILFFAIFLIYPLIYVFKEAFWIGGKFSVEYFKLMFTDEKMIRMLKNSFQLGITVTTVTTLISLPLAYLLIRYKFFGRSLLQSVILIPMIVPPFVGAIGMKQLFGLYGSVNVLLSKIGLVDIYDPIDWFSGGFWGVVVLSALHLYPIMYLNVVAALANVDPSLEEAAENMGASKIELFTTVTLPLMLPGYFAGAIIVFIWAFTDLGTPLIFDYNEVIAVKIFRQVTDANVNPMGYALVVLIITITAICFYISKKMTASRQYAMIGRGHVGSREIKANKTMTTLIYLFVAIVSFIALLPHLSIIMISITTNESALEPMIDILPKSLTIDHYATVFTHSDTLPSIRNSFIYSIFSTILAMTIGLILSYLLTRRSLPFSNLIDAIAMLPLALPGVAIAFGYVGSFSDTALIIKHLPQSMIDVIDPRKNPLLLLIIGYSIRRLPYMLRSIYAGLQQTSITYEEASQNLGATPFQTVVKITLPLVVANIIAGAILVFSFSMLEVSESLILAMRSEHYPITKAIYTISLWVEGGDFVASAMGVLGMIILMTCLIVAGKMLGGRLGEIFKV